MRAYICGFSGLVGSFIAGLFGGWDAAMATLLMFMGIDYITGLLVAAFNKSPKSDTGALNSYVGFKGLAKKCVVLLLVLVAVRLDIMLNTNYVRDAVCVAFSVNELISILENAGILGVPIPDVIKDAIEVLKNSGKKG